MSNVNYTGQVMRAIYYNGEDYFIDKFSKEYELLDKGFRVVFKSKNIEELKVEINRLENLPLKK